MDRGTIKGFFAYPSNPPSISEIVHTAAKEINAGGQVCLKPWDECRVGGKVIILELCREIDESALFCADLTGINANVMFELGYAIARNKRIWLVLDTSIVNAKKDFEQLRTLTTVGYASYCNSSDVKTKFYSESPWSDLGATIYMQSVKPTLSPASREAVLYLKSRHENEASIRLTKRLAKVKIPVVVDDPRESGVQPLAWYGAKIYSALGVVCHLTNPSREGARLHNARYALVAGMAYGMNKALLMLAEGDFLAPVDYQDLLCQYHKTSIAVTRLEEWVRPIEKNWQRKTINQREYASVLRLATELKELNLGEHIAENEADGLVQDYFVETAAYREAFRGSHAIFVGRKGSGKTANLLKLASTLERDSRFLVCVIKPVAYELHGILGLLRRYKAQDMKGYVIESLWKFLLYTEMANAVARSMDHSLSNITRDEKKLEELLNRGDGILKEEFSVRLERCVRMLNELRQGRNEQGSIERSRLAISEALHSTILKELRIVLGRVLAKKKRIFILVDNLDKAWDKAGDISKLSEFLLGLLGAASRVRADFRHADSRRRSADVSLAIFLRTDIFYRVIEVAREPDKIQYSKLAWADPELLLRVIEERFVASHEGNVRASELWERYFCSTVNSIPTKEYLTNRILPRPRDLVFLRRARSLQQSIAATQEWRKRMF